jgi:hypothetical protein
LKKTYALGNLAKYFSLFRKIIVRATGISKQNQAQRLLAAIIPCHEKHNELASKSRGANADFNIDR